MMKKFTKYVAGLFAILMLGGAIAPPIAYADEIHYQVEQIEILEENYSTSAFSIEQEIQNGFLENYTNYNLLPLEEQKIIDSTIQEAEIYENDYYFILNAAEEEAIKQVDLSPEEQEVYKQALLMFYNIDSSDNGSAIEDNIYSPFSTLSRGLISVRLLGSIINVTLSAIAGGALSTFVARRGFSALAIALRSRLAARLQINIVNAVMRGLTGAIVRILDPGYYLASLVDSRDLRPRNGYIELW